MSSAAPNILAYDHAGVRVSDRNEALSFYARLGFALVEEFPEHSACELQSEAGVYLNLIYNAVPTPGRKNILLDDPVKMPGVTHFCLGVSDLGAWIKWFDEENITITEGPLNFERRSFLFIRDPDGNVIEFAESFE